MSDIVQKKQRISEHLIDFKAENLEKPTFVGYIQKLKTSKMRNPYNEEGSAIKAKKNIGPPKIFYDSLPSNMLLHPSAS